MRDGMHNAWRSCKSRLERFCFAIAARLHAEEIRINSIGIPFAKEGSATTNQSIMKHLKTTIASACFGLALLNLGYSQEPGQDPGLKGNPTKMPIDDTSSATKDHLMMMNGKMMVMKDGKTGLMEKEMTLDDGTKVMTNGTVTMKDGKSMKLGEDEMILMNGKVIKRDHLLMKDGKVMVMRDGKMVAMDKEMIFDNGSRIMMDGTVMMKDGKSMKMDDTDMITMDGSMMKIPKNRTGPKSKNP